MKRIVVLGMFDGVHKGHAALIKRACEIRTETGLSVCVNTFSNHPAELITGSAIPVLMTNDERKAALVSSGADEVVFDEFTEKVRDTDCAEFAKQIRDRLSAKYVVAGYNYTFGKGGEGDAQMLCSLCGNLGIDVNIIPPVTYEDLPVSSSRIREAIVSGEIISANAMLGYNYKISGRVEYGRQVGRLLGYPTANIRNAYGKVLPKMGVYVTYFHIDGEVYRGITNVGTNPTFGELGVSIETHIPDFDEDIYGKDVNVEFLRFIREQRKFSGMDELKAQIDEDNRKAREYFGL